MTHKAIFTLVILLLFLYPFALMNSRTPAKAQTIEVPTDYPTIQTAINNASDGDTIFVKEGTYHEDVVVNRSIVLIGENREKTVIDANYSGTAIRIVARNVTITNLTVKGGGPNAYESGVFVDAPFSNVTENTIIENGLFGIYLNNTWSNLVSKNTVGKSQDDGIILFYSANNSFVDNILTENKFGLHLFSSDENIIFNNTFLTNSVGGVSLFYSSSNQLVNNNLTENKGQGIILDYSSNNNNLTGNTIQSTAGYGLTLGSCSNNTLRRNRMNANTYNFYCAGLRPELSDFVNDIDTSNTVDGKPIYYFISQRRLSLDPSVLTNIGYLALVNCTGSTVQDVKVSGNGQGLFLAFTNETMIRNVTATSNNYGIQLLSSFQNILDMCSLTANDEDGMTLDYSSNQNIIVNCTMIDNLNSMRIAHDSNWNTITGNSMLNSTRGLYAYAFVTQNTIINNILSNNTQAISMIRECTDNTITKNTLANNTQALNFTFCSNNLIFNNNFINNSYDALDVNSTNIWDDGYPIGGNYWSQYTDTDQYGGSYQNETGSDGIWDHPFIIDENNKDDYPIVPEYMSPTALLLLMTLGLIAVGVCKKRHQSGRH